MESRLPQQPDFGLMSQNYSVISEQFSLMENLPAVAGAVQFQQTLQQVLEQIRLLSEKVDRAVTALRGDVRGVDRKVATLKDSMEVGMRNVVARQYNASVTYAGMPLSPLYDVETGDLITNFPANMMELDGLEDGQVDIILRRLGETPRGREDAKRRQLVTAVGIVHRHVAERTEDQGVSLRQRQR